MSGFMFGLIIGYLSWYSVKPGDTPGIVPIQRIGALIAVIGGAGILALFPKGSRLFETYSLGLAIGFFFTLARKLLAEAHQFILARMENFKQLKEQEKDIAISQVNEKWIEISDLIYHKLKTSRRVDEINPRTQSINSNDLQELPYPPNIVKYIMRRFAHENAQDGVEFVEREGKPTLILDKWQLY